MQTNERQAYLDWLRILAILGVLFFHSAMAFVAEWGWHIKNKETSYLLMEFNFWLSRFRMPLLFFISGTVSYFMLRNKSAWSFVGLRFRRLLIPLVFGMLLIVPPQVYLERVTKGYEGNFLQFYDKVFEFEAYPSGNFSWHHLWFIWYLFVYDILFAPFFKWATGDKAARFRQRLNFFAKGRRIYWLILPSVIVYASLTLKFPTSNDFISDWCMLFYWLLFLLVGFLCVTHIALMDSLERNRRLSFSLAMITLIAINYIRWNQFEPWDNLSNWRADWRTYAYLSLFASTAWFWVMTAAGYGKRYLNKKLPVLDYLNQAVYPFYILHQTVIVILVFYVVQVEESILAKYLFTLLVTFALCMSIFHLFIRPFAITRLLFGMKPRKLTLKNQEKVLQPGHSSKGSTEPAAA